MNTVVPEMERVLLGANTLVPLSEPSRLSR